MGTPIRQALKAGDGHITLANGSIRKDVFASLNNNRAVTLVVVDATGHLSDNETDQSITCGSPFICTDNFSSRNSLAA
jgi:hypothetical protein